MEYTCLTCNKIFSRYAKKGETPKFCSSECWKLTIEVNGDYWHGNLEVYSDEELTPKQKRRRNIDKTKASFIQNRGIPLLTLWEKDIYEKPEECKNIITNFLNSN